MRQDGQSDGEQGSAVAGSPAVQRRQQSSTSTASLSLSLSHTTTTTAATAAAQQQRLTGKVPQLHSFSFLRSLPLLLSGSCVLLQRIPSKHCFWESVFAM